MKNDGGPLFPQDVWVEDPSGEFPPTKQRFTGASLRDDLAAKVMQVLCTRMGDHDIGQYDAELIASSSYLVSDAMLKEREK